MGASADSIPGSFDPISDQIRLILRRRIIDGTYEAGHRLFEKDLAAEFRVSRTPVRDALRRLVGEGLVEIIPRKGVVVTGMSPNEVLEVFDLRLVLEPLAVQRATRRLTPDIVADLEGILDKMRQARESGNEDELSDLHVRFHMTMYQAASSPRLLDMLATLVDSIQRFSRDTYRVSSRYEEAMTEHAQILEAVRNGDEARAVQLTREHILAARRAYFDMVKGAIGTEDEGPG
ncbi:MAG: GntR family transcriptional regulator [Alicyclobacillus sp.]|nr:GntR family transcriptional regulator [Alicyclobacillus sp.]